MTSVTIYEVAERAGVSITTVSHSLNNPARVRPQTREKVFAAIDELGFVPRSEAVARARRGVGRIGVLAPLTAYASFQERLRGVIDALRPTTMELVLYDQESLAVRADYLSSLPLSNRLDGLIVMSLPFDDDVARRLRSRRLPTVVVEFARDGYSSVRIDDFRGGRLAAEHLAARGHEHIAFVGEAKASVRVQDQATRRVAGVAAALADAGLALADELVSFGEYGVESARRQAAQLLDLDHPPTAVIAHSDTQAVGVLKAARERGLRVPDDLAVIGFDDLDIAEHMGITTIAQPLVESGRVAARLLLDQLAEPSTPAKEIFLPLELVVRETT
ncbi:MAG: LacI family DNA-binding transcriptional regulator [Actinomycetota bacterium]|nr:LacI family DNA-binding transcriptional regulator [Actinomycetota bacterium]